MKDEQRDELLIRIDENVKALREHKDDHEVRLRSVEKHKHFTLGIAAAVSGIVSYLFGK